MKEANERMCWPRAGTLASVCMDRSWLMLIPQLFQCRPEGIWSITQPHMEIGMVTCVMAVSLFLLYSLEYTVKCQVDSLEVCVYSIAANMRSNSHLVQVGRCADDWYMRGEDEGKPNLPFRTKWFRTPVQKVVLSPPWRIFGIPSPFFCTVQRCSPGVDSTCSQSGLNISNGDKGGSGAFISMAEPRHVWLEIGMLVMFMGLMGLSANHSGGHSVSGSFRSSEFSLHRWQSVSFLNESFVSCTLSLLVGIQDYKHLISATYVAV